MNRTLVMGDIHGAARALTQVLERCSFDPESDTLIFLGDVCDGWSETAECIEILRKIPNLIHLLGNHDQWTREWLLSGYSEYIWLDQGGQATVDSLTASPEIMQNCKEFLDAAELYYIKDNQVFVHAGLGYLLDPHPHQLSSQTLLWDREMWANAMNDIPCGKWDEIFIGHTSVTTWGERLPMHRANVWNMDTGCGWSGWLSVMDINTKEVWQSDYVPDLYPEEKGR